MTRGIIYVGFLLLIALTLLSGAIQGRMRQRWGRPEAARAAADDLDKIPEQFGDWRLRERRELDEDVAETLRCDDSYIYRLYQNQETGEVVQIALLLGPAGEISVHTPDICYPASQYAVERERWHVVVNESGGEASEVWALHLKKKDVAAEEMIVYYAWSTGDEWIAPKNPRWTLGGHPFLYKFQVASLLGSGDEAGTDDAGRRFLTDFIPAAADFLHSAAGS